MNVVVTGASKGIGKEIVELFSAKKGVKVIAISRNEELMQQNFGNDPRVRILSGDLCDDDFYTKYQGAIAELPVIDILINNAGYLVNKKFEDLKRADIDQTLETNLIGPLKLIQVTMRKLLSAENGHVVNISSMGGVQGSSKFPGLSVYSSSKSALIGLTECLAEEYKSTNIRFNSLALGAVKTEMLVKAFPGFDAPVSALDMAKYIVDFAITGGRYINGKIIQVALTTP